MLSRGDIESELLLAAVGESLDVANVGGRLLADDADEPVTPALLAESAETAAEAAAAAEGPMAAALSLTAVKAVGDALHGCAPSEEDAAFD
jgi:hypothetical protein